MASKSSSQRKADKHKAPPVKLRPEPPPVRPNRRDRDKISSHVTMNFLGAGGIFRARVNHAARVLAPRAATSSRGTAAKTRAEPLRHYLAHDPVRMRAAFVRHVHPRSRRKDKEYCDARFEEYVRTLGKEYRDD